MKIKIAGIYKDENFTDRIEIQDLVNHSAPEKRKLPWKIKFYLYKSPCFAATAGAFQSILTGEYVLAGDSMHTDGKWVWFSSIIHYYENEKVELEPEFLKYLESVWTPYPLIFAFKNFIMRGKLVSEIDDFVTFRAFKNEENKL